MHAGTACQLLSPRCEPATRPTASDTLLCRNVRIGIPLQHPAAYRCHLMPAPWQQLPAVCTSLRCCGPELAACVVHGATGGRPARRPPEQPALACGGG